MTRRTSRASRALFLLLLFALQTFLPAFANCPDYTYDRTGNLLTAQSSNDNGLMSAHSYDALNRLATTSDNSVSPAFVQSYSYDRVGNLQTSTAGNGLTHRYSYSNLNRLTHLSIGTLEVGGASSSPATADFATLGVSYTYTLNKAGHRTAVEDYRNIASQTSTRTINYTYDKLYRLTSETVVATSGPPVPSGTISYTHDKVGNRLTRTSSNPILRALLPDQSQSYNTNDQLTTHTHDANGNTTSSPSPLNSIAYAEGSSVNDVYDFRNKLIRRTLPDGSTIDLAYNADALLIAKGNDGVSPSLSTYYLQDTNNHTGYAQIVEELAVQGASSPLVFEVYALNVPRHDLLHTHQLRTDPDTGITDWSTHHYLYDGLGSVRALADDSGAITDTFEYDAFGTLLHSTGDTPNAYLYTGERFDPDLGFYYLRARYHDPNLGRFHTLDTYEGRNGEPLTLHKYLYTHGNPVNGTDPSGNLTLSELATSFSVKATLARFSLGAVHGFADAIINGQDGAGIAGSVLRSGLGGAFLAPLAGKALAAGGFAKWGLIATAGVLGTVQGKGIYDNFTRGEFGRGIWNSLNMAGVISLRNTLSFKNAFRGLANSIKNSPSAQSNGVGLSGVTLHEEN